MLLLVQFGSVSLRQHPIEPIGPGYRLVDSWPACWHNTIRDSPIPSHFANISLFSLISS